MKCPDPAKLSKYYESGANEDFEAFVDGVDQWIFKRVRNAIRGAVIGKYELAEDLTWVVIRKIFESRCHTQWVSERGGLNQWLCKMISNQVSSYLRVKSNQLRICTDYQVEKDEGKRVSIEEREIDRRTTSPLESVLQREQLAEAERVLQNFPADTQRAVKLCYEQELTYREIAEVIGSNPTTVFRQIAAVRERLARLLEADQLAA